MDKKNWTGYPHIDRPWMQYYEKGADEIRIPNINLKKYLEGKNIGRESLIAEIYYGRKTSYGEFFDGCDLASQALSQVGVKKGDMIMFLVPNIPETSRLWLGATQLGAISDFVDPRPDSMNIEANARKVLELIKYEKANYIVALDKCYLGMLKPIENELKELGIDTIILLSATDSMNLSGKIDYLKDVINYKKIENMRITDEAVKLNIYRTLSDKLKAMKGENKRLTEALKSSPLRIIKYADLVRECANSRFDVVSEADLINYIGHTSGTSGSRPKPITATNRNGMSTLEQLIKGNVSFEKGDRVLHVLPYFAPFGAYDNFLLNLASGSIDICVPEFKISEFGYLIKKHLPNVIVGTPAWLAALPGCDYLENMDLSCIKRIIYGGDSMTIADEEHLNEWLKKHGSKAVVEKGHGMSEFLGCGSYAQKSYNSPGSIGIPLPGTIYAIADPDKEELVPLRFEKGQKFLEGELIVSSEAVTPGILYDEIIVSRYELDGEEFIKTGDIARMYRNGEFYIINRMSRMFTRVDGFKVKPYEIEREILKNPKVKYACVVGYHDEKRRGLMPICHVVLDKEYSQEEALEIVKEIVYNIIDNPNMSSRQIPAKFKVREKMPLSKNSKVDYEALKREGLTGEEIIVDVDETNLQVGAIKIYALNRGKTRTRAKKD